MWNLNEHALLARLPNRKLEYRSLNGRPGSDHSDLNAEKEGPPSAWDEKFAKLHEYAQYEDDWDGQGATGLPGALAESAIQLAQLLQSAGIAPPSSVVPGVNGTINFEWRLDGGSSIEIEVTGPYAAEIGQQTLRHGSKSTEFG